MEWMPSNVLAIRCCVTTVSCTWHAPMGIVVYTRCCHLVNRDVAEQDGNWRYVCLLFSNFLKCKAWQLKRLWINVRLMWTLWNVTESWKVERGLGRVAAMTVISPLRLVTIVPYPIVSLQKSFLLNVLVVIFFLSWHVWCALKQRYRVEEGCRLPEETLSINWWAETLAGRCYQAALEHITFLKSWDILCVDDRQSL